MAGESNSSRSLHEVSSKGWNPMSLFTDLRRLGGWLAAALLVTLMTSSVAAARADSQTQVFKDTSEAVPAENPCTGDPGTLTQTYNGAYHFTTDPNGGTHGTLTLAGTFLFEPDDAALPSYSGRFAFWVGLNTTLNNGGYWETLTVNGIGSDGSTLRANVVIQIHASNGELQVEFLKLECRI